MEMHRPQCRPSANTFHFYLATVLATALGLMGSQTTWATSTGKRTTLSPSVCQTEARFRGASLQSGKVSWSFDRLTQENSPACRDLEKTFSVWVWSGSYSTLSKSFVYPLSITEPETGSELKLRIERRSVRESLSPSRIAAKAVQGWFLAGDEDGSQVLRK